MSRCFVAFVATWIYMFGACVAAEPDGEKSFQSYADLVIGGVWEHTDKNGKTYQHKYTWLTKGRFMLMTGNGPGSPGKVVLGVDPKTGMATNWGYNDDGSIAVGYPILKEEGVWKFHGEVHEPGGKTKTWKGTLTKVDDNTIHVEFENSEGRGVETWRRKR